MTLKREPEPTPVPNVIVTKLLQSLILWRPAPTLIPRKKSMIIAEIYQHSAAAAAFASLVRVTVRPVSVLMRETSGTLSQPELTI